MKTRSSLLLPLCCLALFGGAGCEGEAQLALFEEELDEGAEFVCPLPEREGAELGPLPEADPARLTAEPTIGARCAIPSKTLQRLNRAEYENSVQDLLGIDVDLADGFPTDHSDEGFDNLAEVLTVSPILVEKYFEAAHLAADAALDRGVPRPRTQLIEAETYLGGNDVDGYARIDRGNRAVQISIPWEGEYRIRAMAYGEQAGAENVRMDLTLGYGDEAPVIGSFEVAATAEDPRLYQGSARLVPGFHVIVVRFLNDFARPEDRGNPALNRNLIVDFLEVDGPYDAAPGPEPESRRQILSCQPGEESAEGDGDGLSLNECAAQVLAPLARRALKRPIPEDELERYIGFVRRAEADGQPFDEGVKLALRALLLHPEFLFRVETDPDLSDDDPHRLTDHQLATRLSYFLWSSLPDERLLDLADEGALYDPVIFEGEVRRMLQDERTRALVENFAGQWLSTRRVDDVHLSDQHFPRWDDDFQAAARCETELFFDDLLQSGGTVEDLLLAEHTYVNEELAEHYNLDTETLEFPEPPAGGHEKAAFTRVSLEGTERGGLLTQTSFLAQTSHPLRTSPVKRGKWVLEQLMCSAPPPPPPNVEGGIDEDADATTLREQLEQHRSDPACASCHVLMDPIGLGLENFDAMGRYRRTDNDLPIDASSMLFDTHPFEGPTELAHLLAEREEPARCAVQKALTYATGVAARPGLVDRCTMEAAVAAFDEEEHRLDELFVIIARSAAFQLRRAGPEEDAALVAELEAEEASSDNELDDADDTDDDSAEEP